MSLWVPRCVPFWRVLPGSPRATVSFPTASGTSQERDLELQFRARWLDGEAVSTARNTPTTHPALLRLHTALSWGKQLRKEPRLFVLRCKDKDRYLRRRGLLFAFFSSCSDHRE